MSWEHTSPLEWEEVCGRGVRALSGFENVVQGDRICGYWGADGTYHALDENGASTEGASLDSLDDGVDVAVLPDTAVWVASIDPDAPPPPLRRRALQRRAAQAAEHPAEQSVCGETIAALGGAVCYAPLETRLRAERGVPTVVRQSTGEPVARVNGRPVRNMDEVRAALSVPVRHPNGALGSELTTSDGRQLRC